MSLIKILRVIGNGRPFQQFLGRSLHENNFSHLVHLTQWLVPKPRPSQTQTAYLVPPLIWFTHQSALALDIKLGLSDKLRRAVSIRLIPTFHFYCIPTLLSLSLYFEAVSNFAHLIWFFSHNCVILAFYLPGRPVGKGSYHDALDICEWTELPPMSG